MGIQTQEFRENELIINYVSIGKGYTVDSKPPSRFSLENHTHTMGISHTRPTEQILDLIPAPWGSSVTAGVFEVGVPWLPHKSASPLWKRPTEFPAVWVSAELKIQLQKERSHGGSNSDSKTQELIHRGVKTKPLL